MKKNKGGRENETRRKTPEKNDKEKRAEKVQRNLLVLNRRFVNEVVSEVEEEINLEERGNCTIEVDVYYIVKGGRKVRIEKIPFKEAYVLGGGIESVTAHQVNSIMDIL